MNQADLLDFLSATGLDEADIKHVMESREVIILKGQDRTNAMMSNAKFRNWLVSPSPQELLVHGNSNSRPISSLSFFCAMLVLGLRGVDKFWPVVFFCGCHPYWDYGGPRTMITSLIAQLLVKRPFDLSFVNHEHVYQMDIGNIETFCYVFSQLIQQVDADETVFCVIDGINYYEGQEEILQETASALRILLDLSKGHKVFKILVTSPSSTEFVRQAIEDEDYLALSDHAQSTQGFSELRFERRWNESLGT